MSAEGPAASCGFADTSGHCIASSSPEASGWEKQSWLTHEQKANLEAARISFEAGESEVTHYPLVMDLVLDLRCNLRCVMCNEEPARRSGETTYDFPFQERKDTLEEFFRRVVSVVITGGEPSVSPHFEPVMEMLRKADGARATICTNGQLLREVILPHRGRIASIHLSVDAATEETYERIRVGGSWNKLRDGLDAVADALADGSLASAYTFNVISRWNYHEMEGMVKLAASLGMQYLKFDEVREEPGMSIPELKFRIEDKEAVLSHLEAAISAAREEGICLSYSFHTFGLSA
jgi:MoaA/NifB/PqqE/SkfB family radical SAM enzyme